MSPSAPFTFFFIVCFLSRAAYSASTRTQLAVAPDQLKFWSQNVQNAMPKSVLSKLSPLSKHDSDYFTALISKKSFSANAQFCSLANLACSSELNSIRPLAQGYNSYVVTKASLFMEKPDPFSFFRLSVLKEGKNIHLTKFQDNYPDRAFLPFQIASKISLTSNKIQQIFPQSFASPVTKEAILETIDHCSSPALKGEIKTCPRSLEEMIGFAKSTLGTKHLVSLTSKSTRGSGSELLIGKVNRINADKVVACHETFLPFSAYFCHLISSTRVYAVDLLNPVTKAPVNTAIATCHMDTSAWPPSHVAFKILKVSPGETEACHWMTQVDIAFAGDDVKMT